MLDWPRRLEDVMTQEMHAGEFPADLSREAGALRPKPSTGFWQRVLARMQKPARRRALRELSDRQLTDAGIDPTAAGRGKAVAVEFNPRIHVGS